MNLKNILSRKSRARRARASQQGTAIIIAVMVMALLAIFVAASISRVTNETLMMSNDQANTDAYFAAQASLEHMSRNFSDVFDVRITPTTTDITNIQNDVPPGYNDYQITQVLARENPGSPPEQTTVDVSSPFAGLVALREGWRLNATALSSTGAEARLTRTLNNYTIPIFQFGIFYDDPQEHHPGPAFNFGGRVHSNGDIYLMAGNNSTRFRDRVTAAGEVVVDVARNGSPYTNWGYRVYVNDGTGTYRSVSQGSVTGGPDIAHTDADLPDGSRNANWPTFSAQFRGNLIARSPRLQLPLQLGGQPPIAIIRRGLPTDDSILRDSRYYNKPCIRVTLSNSQAQLPGGSGGVQLNAVNQPNAANT
ncbi:MAG TPA: pilus assembly PilX N-terminal domain-containing protein, partial [Pirellulaceae bacterium]|nr:pilus assembly PilX N-terminal domain-containing protein [Pirellulaceae bacterium]